MYMSRVHTRSPAETHPEPEDVSEPNVSSQERRTIPRNLHTGGICSSIWIPVRGGANRPHSDGFGRTQTSDGSLTLQHITTYYKAALLTEGREFFWIRAGCDELLHNTRGETHWHRYTNTHVYTHTHVVWLHSSGPFDQIL